ncbi:sel1 repeat family protein [Pseudolabrys sp. Root1462]|uniref:tetratricopeptide repeat protein n=1 Tax=Pseudolabrys sp. Root1462 TaxID=1736466 RepID=UPI0012E34BBC|nr:sel1 repeat family protein [Pseudolabrys sp. Root1462]
MSNESSDGASDSPNGKSEITNHQEPNGTSTKSGKEKASEWARKLYGFLSQSLGRTGIIVGVVLLVILAFAAFFVVDKILSFYLTKGYVEQIGDAFDLNRNLVRALVLASFVIVVYFGNAAWSFSRRKRMIGIAGILALLIGHSLVLWVATRQQFFNREGAATKCYVVTRDGSVTYGERVGIDPATGRQCRPVTAEVLERLREYEKGKRPQLVTSNEPVFFEPRTGEPVVWYYRSKNNGIEIFDLMGFHPETGEELLPVDKDTVEAWKAQTKARLARIPKRVDPKEYAFFDARSGTPRAWYWKDKAGHYEFFDSPGFHPLTGQTLLVVTPEIVDESRSKVEPRVPKAVDIKTATPFDPQTGETRLWFSRDAKGQLEFFDGPGFNPKTGVKLEPFTRSVMEQWQNDLKEQQEKIERERRQRAEEVERFRREQAEREAAEKEKQAAQEAAERDRVAREKERISRAANDCDTLAGNPNDTQHVGSGTSFDSLKAQAREAVTACDLAVTQNPNQSRFRYQLARALHWTDRPRAASILERLVREGYPAAYDNLGWLYLTERKNPQMAMRLFQEGMARGDSDSIVSLVEMIDRGHLQVANPAAEKAKLLCRAAQLGHQAAQLSCQTALAEAQRAEQERQQQLQAQQMMLQIMGGAISNIPRR